jgi:hypothetical protein
MSKKRTGETKEGQKEKSRVGIAHQDQDAKERRRRKTESSRQIA